LNTLHIDTGVEMRGGQWQALYLLRGLAEYGHGVRLLAPAGSPLLQAAAAQQLDARPLRLSGLFAATRGMDLIHAHDARGHTLAVLTGKPAIVSRRVGFPVKRNLASRWKYGRAAHFIAVSQYVLHALVEAGVDASRITVVYDGVPIHALTNAEQRTRVVALDSDDPAKGKKIVERAAELAGIAIHFSTNLLRDFPEAALFVYITDLEGLGSAVLLAMANGAPVLASAVGGLPEIVEDGVNGLLTSNEPEAVAQAMRRLVGDGMLASRLAARGRVRVEKEFSVERMANETLRVYERILS
jgi:hypothetical protein